MICAARSKHPAAVPAAPEAQGAGGSENPLLLRLANFAALSPGWARDIMRLFDATHVICRGQDIVENGDDADEVFALMEGWAARYVVMRDGGRQITELVLPGDVFPLTVGPAGKIDHGIMALTLCTVVSAHARTFNSRVLADPRLAQAFWWITIADKAILRAWVANLGHRSAYSRLAHLLCELAARLKMVGLSDGVSFDFPLTQQEIADAQGLTTVHTNRMIKQLRASGLIEWHHKRLTILDPARLQQLAEFDPAYLNPGH